MENEIDFPDMVQELITQPFPPVGTLDQACNIDNIHVGADDFFRMEKFGKGFEARIVQDNRSLMGVDRAERIGFRGNVSMSKGVKKS